MGSEWLILSWLPTLSLVRLAGMCGCYRFYFQPIKYFTSIRLLPSSLNSGAKRRVHQPVNASIRRSSVLHLSAHWLVSSLKDSFPLHHIVFRQCASHLQHDGNSENTFSMTENQSTCNTQPIMLRLLTKTEANKKLYNWSPKSQTYGNGIKPSTKAYASMSMARPLLIPSPQTVPIPILVATNKCEM